MFSLLMIKSTPPPLLAVLPFKLLFTKLSVGSY